MNFINYANRLRLSFQKIILQGRKDMKKVNYTIILPNDNDIESVMIKIKRKDNEGDRKGRPKGVKRGTFVLKKFPSDKETDEGLLFDELY